MDAVNNVAPFHHEPDEVFGLLVVARLQLLKRRHFIQSWGDEAHLRAGLGSAPPNKVSSNTRAMLNMAASLQPNALPGVDKLDTTHHCVVHGIFRRDTPLHLARE